MSAVIPGVQFFPDLYPTTRIIPIPISNLIHLRDFLINSG